MKRRLSILLGILILTLSLVIPAMAQEYSFRLEAETVNVFWNSDGTLTLDYLFVFSNDPGAHAIDFVDVGMPNGHFDFNSITADVNGVPVGISRDYQGDGAYGFAVDLGAQAIPPGQTGQVHVRVGRITHMLYPDDNEPDTYASGEFSPTWFGSAYVHGTTNLTVIFHMPPGVQPQEPRYHLPRGGWPCASEPTAAYDAEGRIAYTWSCPTAAGDTQYTFGLSFPRQYVPASAITKPSVEIDWESLLGLACLCGCFLLFVVLPVWATIQGKKRKLEYLPPKISIEGHGIKRGLTAVEAAILMEQPLDKVLTMILFGVLKKGAASVVRRDPLDLEIASPLPEGLHEYEREFLAAFEDKNLATRRKKLQEMTVNLVKSVAEKMKGFSRKETIAYYQSIMERAWQQIEAAETPEIKSQMYDQALEWTMLDKDYDDRTRRVFTGPVYVPVWWGRYDPTFHPVSASVAPATAARPAAASGSGRAPISVPGASFAASLVNGVQGMASKVVGNVQAFTAGVTNRTNPPPVSTTSSSGRFGGGGGCACACACACAGCACACAGGGR
jgi:hypothetical protein